MSKTHALWRTVQSFAVKNSPALCLGFGIACYAGSVIFTAIGTVKAVKKIQQLEAESETGEISTKEKLKAGAVYYIPAVLSFAGGTVGVLASNKIVSTRAAALGAALQLSEDKLEKIEEKTKELVGEKKADEIKDAVAMDQAFSIRPTSEADIVNTGRGNTIVCDPWSKRYYRTSITWIERAFARLNDAYGTGDEISMEEFYYHLGWEVPKFAEDYIWRQRRKGELIEPRPTYGSFNEEGEPMYIIGFSIEPKLRYESDIY